MSDADFLVENDDVIIARKTSGVELLPLGMAAKLRAKLLKKYLWRMRDKVDEQHVRKLESVQSSGYWVYMAPELKSSEPLKTCFHITEDGFSQYVHNVVVVDKNAELNLQTYCSADDCSGDAAHYALSEIYLEAGAKLTLTMIHNWQLTSRVYPITLIHAAEDCQIEQNYLCVDSPAHVSSNPQVFLNGANSTCVSNSIVITRPGSYCDIGGELYLDGAHTGGKLVSKIVTLGGETINRAAIIATEPTASGHTQCDGLVMKNEGLLESVPLLKNIDAQAELSHEASIGRLKPEAVNYLMSRGIGEETATELLVAGFMDLDALGDDVKVQFEAQIDETFARHGGVMM